MKYVEIKTDNRVGQIITRLPFPNKTLEEQYAPEFVATLLQRDDGEEVKSGWLYDPKKDAFEDVPLPEPEPTPEPEPEPEPGDETITTAEATQSYREGVNSIV